MSKLDLLIKEINKEAKSEIIRVGPKYEKIQRIPLSSPRANYMTYGGIPLGRATELFGSEGSGKTTTALDAVARAQKQFESEYLREVDELSKQLQELEEKNNKSDQDTIKKLRIKLAEVQQRGKRRIVYCDAENTLDRDWAVKQGVDLYDMYLMQPQTQTAEQVFEILLNFMRTGEVGLIVLDSIPMLVPQQIYEKTMEQKSYGGVSGPLTQFCAKASPLIEKHQIAFIGINQVRDDIDNPHNQYSTPGGRAWKHLCALRLHFRKGSFIDADNGELPMRAEEPKGNIVNIGVMKTKICKPDRRVGQYTIKYDIGIDVVSDTLHMAIMYGFIVQAGAWYKIIDPTTGEIMKNNEQELSFQGRAKILEYLREDEELFNEIWEAVNLKLSEDE